MPSVAEPTGSQNTASISERPECRPEEIDNLIEGVDRYNPSNSTVLEEYLAQQCADCTYDGLANLALLKLYQFNPHLLKDESVTSRDSSYPDASLAESVQKLQEVHTLLNNAQYAKFWRSIEGDDLYADLIADVNGFEDTIRRYVTLQVAQAAHSVGADLLQEWLNLRGDAFNQWIRDAGWTVDSSSNVQIPINKENAAVSRVTNEKITLNDLSKLLQHSRDV